MGSSTVLAATTSLTATQASAAPRASSATHCRTLTLSWNSKQPTRPSGLHYPLIAHATMLLTDGHISLALNDIDTDVHTVAGGHGKVTSFSGTIRGQHFSLKPPHSGPPGNPWNGWKYGLKQITVRGETCGGGGRYSSWPNSYGTNCAPRIFPWQGAVKAVMLECETDDGDVYYGE